MCMVCVSACVPALHKMTRNEYEFRSYENSIFIIIIVGDWEQTKLTITWTQSSCVCVPFTLRCRVQMKIYSDNFAWCKICTNTFHSCTQLVWCAPFEWEKAAFAFYSHNRNEFGVCIWLKHSMLRHFGTMEFNLIFFCATLFWLAFFWFNTQARYSRWMGDKNATNAIQKMLTLYGRFYWAKKKPSCRANQEKKPAIKRNKLFCVHRLGYNRSRVCDVNFVWFLHFVRILHVPSKRVNIKE